MELATQIIIITGVIIFAIGFSVLVIAVISALGRLKVLFVQMENMSMEVTDLAKELKTISMRVEDKLDSVDKVIDLSKTAAKVVGDIAIFAGKSVFAKGAGIMALLPAVKLGWKLIKDMKGEHKNVE